MNNVENLHHINTGVKYTGCQNKLPKNIQIHVCRLINISEFICLSYVVCGFMYIYQIMMQLFYLRSITILIKSNDNQQISFLITFLLQWKI